MSQSTEKATGECDRRTFMASIRASLDRAAGAALNEPAPVVDESIARLTSADEDLLELFAQRAEAIGMNVARTSKKNLAADLVAFLRDAGAKRIVTGFSDSGSTAVLTASLTTALREAGMQLHDWRGDDGMDAQFDLDAGITDVQAALAETGSIICATDADHGRGQSLIPPIHVAVVARSDILPDLFDYCAKYKEVGGRNLPSSIAIITGPSKTADIEGVLITGVHGPGKVHILLVEDA